VELRTVDPRKLRENPNNPRKTPAGKDADAQLIASIKAIGIRQPPLVQPTSGTDALTIAAGHRRVKAAIKAGMKAIIVLVQDEAGAEAGPMVAVAENVVRAEMGPVDRWRAMEALAGAGWTNDAIAVALNLTARAISQLRLLAKICPAMLDRMAQGDMPGERELRTIAAATPEEQAAVWAKNKPTRTGSAPWWQIATALTRRRMSARHAKFGADEAVAFGIAWEEDLFAPANEDSRTTTQIDAFMAAQQAWLEANLPANGCIVAASAHGQPILPKGACVTYGKAGAADVIAHCIDERTGEIRTAVFTPAAKREKPAAGGGEGGQPDRKPRPDLTQKGAKMVGDLRTDALHQALRERTIDDDTLIGMLALALGSKNVEIRPGVNEHCGSRAVRQIAGALVDGGVLTRDSRAVRHAATEILVQVLSCRENQSASGMSARYAGMAIDADAFLPNMATAEFLPCLTKAALELGAKGADVAVHPRGKETRAAMVERFAQGTWVYPGARFAPTEAERVESRAVAWELADDDAEPGDDGDPSDERGPGAEELDCEDQAAA
jgi:ParB family chromosome partitioning protein